MNIKYYMVGVQADRYKRKVKFYAISFGLAICVLISICTWRLTSLYKDLQIDTIEHTVRTLEAKRVKELADKDTEIDELHTMYREVIEGLEDEISYINGEIEAQELRENFDMSDALSDMELARKYSYLIELLPANSEIDFDVIRFCDEQCKIWDVNPHWMWAIYYHESRWDPSQRNPKSDARGLGQVLSGTGKSYWVNILGHSNYSHDMAYDPYVNIEITVAHIGRNHQNSMHESLSLYSGGAATVFDELVRIGTNIMGVSLSENNRFYE